MRSAAYTSPMTDLRALAAQLAAAHAGAPLAPPVALRTAADAYAVQDLVWAKLRPGQRPAAWKVGGPDDRVEPTAAPLLAVHASPARVRGGEFRMIGVEAEVAYRFARDVRDEKALAAAIGEIVVAIEICDTRLADHRGASELWKLADFQNNGCLVAGSGRKDWRRIDFSAQDVELKANGKSLVSKARHPYGDPYRLLPWIVAHVARRTGGLRAGDFVTTGSWGGMHLVEAPCEVTAAFAGIGEARLSIVQG